MDRNLDQLLDMLKTAASRITPEYFQLPVADRDDVYRERVYCYELYHQLRGLWNGFPFSLGGEVDKRGNPHFRRSRYANAKPDLLVHIPRQMGQNLAVVEVKSAKVRDNDLGKDLQKLDWFCRHAQYFRGIMMIYGDSGDIEDIREKFRRAIADNEITTAALVLLYHRSVGKQPEVVGL